MFTAIINDRYPISSPTIAGLKRKASIVANRYNEVIDIMDVTCENGEYRYRRFNKKGPWGENIRGQWR